MTLPEPIVDAAGIAEGERFIVQVDAADPDTIRLHRIRSSYAGALRDVYDDAAAYLAGERGSWSPR